MLYHAIKLYKLNPELHWYASGHGGYIWPMDRVVDVNLDGNDGGALPFNAIGSPRSRAQPPMRGTFSYGEEEENESLRLRVEESGAVPLAEADILLLSDWQGTTPVCKERVPFISNGELEKLVVNVLLVVYVA